MSGKMIGAISATISMVSVAVMFILNMAGVPNSWFAVFIGGVVVVGFSSIASAANADKKDKK